MGTSATVMGDCGRLGQVVVGIKPSPKEFRESDIKSFDINEVSSGVLMKSKNEREHDDEDDLVEDIRDLVGKPIWLLIKMSSELLKSRSESYVEFSFFDLAGRHRISYAEAELVSMTCSFVTRIVLRGLMHAFALGDQD